MLTIDMISISNQKYIHYDQQTKESKQARQLLVFRSTQQLFNEIKCDSMLQITTNQSYCLLHIPIQITFKGRRIQLKLMFPLILFEDQNQKCRYLFKQIKQIHSQNRQLKNWHYQDAKQISFKPNINYNQFQISENQITLTGKQNQHATLNHMNPLSAQGIFCFKIKVIKSPTKNVFIGIRGKEVVQMINSHNSPYFMCLYLYNGRLYGNINEPKIVCPQLQIVERQTVIKVEININTKQIGWYADKSLLYSTKIWKLLAETNIYPIVNLRAQGDILEIVN